MVEVFRRGFSQASHGQFAGMHDQLCLFWKGRPQEQGQAAKQIQQAKLQLSLLQTITVWKDSFRHWLPRSRISWRKERWHL